MRRERYRIGTVSGFILTIIFALLASLHGYWALGGRRGWSYVLPTTRAGVKLLNPSPMAAWVVTFAFLTAIMTTLGRIGVWGAWIPRRLFRWAMRMISVVFLLRAVGDFRMVGFFKTIKGTPFARWDNRLYSPLCLGIAVLAALTDAECAEG